MSPRIFNRIADDLKERYNFAISNIPRETIFLYTGLILITLLGFFARIFPFFRYEVQLGAFDPHSQIKAARYIDNNGLYAFFQWIDPFSWYPFGRYWGGSQYIGTPISALILYRLLRLFGLDIPLTTVAYFTPALLGALSSLAIYFLGKELANKRVGLISGFVLAISPAHIQRTNVGFFDNEALGILLLILVCYFFMRALRTGSLLSGLMSGFCLGILGCSWGAFRYPVLLIALFAFILILFRKDSSRLLTAYASTMLVAFSIVVAVPRTGPTELLSSHALGAFAIFALLIFMHEYRYVRQFITDKQFIYALQGTALTAGIMVAVVTAVLWYTENLEFLGAKFLSVVLPMFREDVPILASVSEHLILSWSNLFENIYVTAFFFPVGFYYVYRAPTERNIFILTFAFTALYFAGSMVRLLLILAPAAALIVGKAIDETLIPFALTFQERFALSKRKARVSTAIGNEHVAVAFALIGAILLLVLVHGMENATEKASPPAITTTFPTQTGGTVSYGDWQETLMWIDRNVAEYGVIASWWDYGYWITVNSNATTIADNATINSTQIGNIGLMMMYSPLEALKIAKAYDVKYFLINLASGVPGWGSDLGKAIWMIRIGSASANMGDLDVDDYYSEDEGLYINKFYDGVLWKLCTAGLSGNAEGTYVTGDQAANQIKGYGPLQEGAEKMPTFPDMEKVGFKEAYHSRNWWVRLWEVDYSILGEEYSQ